MTAADDFTRADALFRQALSKMSKDGATLQVMPTRKRWHVVAAIVGSVAALVLSVWVRS